MLRLANEDDLREDLELAVMELQDRFGVAPSSIRRYVNGTIRAKSDRDGLRATQFLRKRWKGARFQTTSRPIGNDEISPRARSGGEQ
jgi:hypothetical protein